MNVVDAILSMQVPMNDPKPMYRIYIGDPETRKHVVKDRHHYQCRIPADSSWSAVKKEMGRLSIKLYGANYASRVGKPQSIDGLIVDTPYQEKIIVRLVKC